MLPGVRRVENMLPVGRALHTLETTIAELSAADSADSPLLHALQHCADDGMSTQRIRDEVMTIFLAGHDTTAAALTWTWLLLARHEDVRRTIEQEVHDVARGRIPEAADALDLVYTEAVVKEVLRLYPPISRIGRRPLRDIDICGTPVPAGTPVFVSPYVTQRDARWFDEPERFLPERWLRSEPPRRFAYYPFGAGPRSCIGEHFARRSIVLALATLVTRWRLTPERRDLPRARSLLTLKPRGAVRTLTCPHAAPRPVSAASPSVARRA
jgi:cytochrome P450